MSIQLVDACTYPGILDFQSATYSCSHGITPGLILIRTKAPPTFAAAVGAFTFSDGARSVTLTDCKLDEVHESHGTADHAWDLTLLDRRWRWRYGSVSGHYNRLDNRGNLIPRYARTPKELAEICLAAMGETGYTLDLPAGVSRQQLDLENENPAPGQRTPPTNTNPEVIWDDLPPAQALAQLCDTFGRRVVFDPISNTVKILRPGFGANLPVNERLFTVQQAARDFERPYGLGIAGAVVRHQGRFKLEPVGREWDGRYVPIDQLSYRPNRKPQAGEYVLKITPAETLGGSYSVTANVNNRIVNGSASSPEGALVGLAAGIVDLDTGLTTRIDGLSLTLTGTRVAQNHTIAVLFDGPPGSSYSLVTTKPPYASCWDGEGINSFAGVRATSRLSYEQARSLAIDTVWKYYRLANEDVDTGWDLNRPPSQIFVPGYGFVPSRQHLILEPTMVEQLTPQPVNPDLVQQGSPVVEIEFYDGYSKDRAAVVYGSVANTCYNRWYYANAGANTAPNTRVALNPTIDGDNWLVIFPQPVYFQVPIPSAQPSNFASAARLALETSVIVRDVRTLAPVRYRRWIEFEPRATDSPTGEQLTVDLSQYQLPSTGPVDITLPPRRDNTGFDADATWPQGIEWHTHDDVPYGVIGNYIFDTAKQTWKYVNSGPSPDDVAAARADYYLLGHLLEHYVQGGASATYKGVEPTPLDGRIMAVTYSVGGGVTTQLSQNREHGVFTLPYPARRRAENLAPDIGRVKANMESTWIRSIMAFGSELRKRIGI
jgi:hypothetical protein